MSKPKIQTSTCGPVIPLTWGTCSYRDTDSEYYAYDEHCWERLEKYSAARVLGWEPDKNINIVMSLTEKGLPAVIVSFLLDRNYFYSDGESSRVLCSLSKYNEDCQQVALVDFLSDGRVKPVFLYNLSFSWSMSKETGKVKLQRITKEEAVI